MEPFLIIIMIIAAVLVAAVTHFMLQSERRLYRKRLNERYGRGSKTNKP